MRGNLKLNWGDEYQGARIEKGYVTILVEAKIRRMCVRIYKRNHVNVSSIRIIECPIRGGRRRYETIVESWRKNLQSFREMAGLIGRSIDLHYGSLLFSLFLLFLDSPSVLVRREGKRLLALVQRGGKEEEERKEEGFDGIDESLSFLFLSSPPPFFLPFQKHGTTPLGADAPKDPA